MRTKIFFIVSLFLISFGCKEEKKIEIIPSSEVYFPLNELDEYPKMTDQTKTNKELRALADSMKQVYQSLPEEEKNIFITDYRFLVNENGKVDKIQIFNSKYPQIDKIVVEVAKIIQYTSATKDGKKVKFIFPQRYDYNYMKYLTLGIPQNDFDQDSYLVTVEEMPEPIGGMFSIQEKIIYPEIAKRAGIEGKVFVLAFIDEKGNVVQAKIIKGIGAGCDEVALNAIKETKFIPGGHNGRTVKTQVSIPIVFKLQ